MCGIAGVFYRDRAREPQPALLAAMSGALAHRGPDNEGFLVQPGIGLAHRRLSIIDLEGGDQPVYNEDGSVGVIFNGELYNYRSVVDRLSERGHRFRTKSDTETLVHLYEEHGADLVQHVRGMFAFAIWDAPRQRLLLARDRLGIKPLYLYFGDDRLVFGSELRAVLADPDVPREIDAESLESYLALGMVPAPRSILRRVHKLKPGHVAVVSREHWTLRESRYWSLERQVRHDLDEDEWAEAIDAKLDDAVKMHLVSDVPVGAFLSGGVDSSLIVMKAARQLSEPIRTFSIGITQRGESELPYARMVADAAGSLHHEETVTVDEALDETLTIAKTFDEPFADTSAIPTLLVSRLARSEVKVVLSGDGGDEGFAGYERYAHDLREARLRDKLPSAVRALSRTLGSIWPKADFLPRALRAKTTLENLGAEAAEAYANTVTTGRQPWRRRLLRSAVVERLNGYAPADVVAEAYREGSDGALARMLASDVAVLLPDRFLTKVDRASMSVGLEVRPPLLDHELLEMAATIPSEILMSGGEPKSLLKRVARSIVPSRALDRPKRGFDLPIDDWLRGPLGDRYQDEVVLGSGPLEDWIDRSEASRLLSRHRSGLGSHGELLWTVMVLALWADENLRAPESHHPDRALVEPAGLVSTP